MASTIQYGLRAVSAVLHGNENSLNIYIFLSVIIHSILRFMELRLINKLTHA